MHSMGEIPLEDVESFSAVLGMRTCHVRIVLRQWLSRVRLCEDPGLLGPPGSSVRAGFSRRVWSGLPCLPPGDLPNPGMEPRSPAYPGGFFLSEPQGSPCHG